METTSSVYDYITLRGVIVPDTSDILSEVQQEWVDVFGSDLILMPDTPQGVMITGETLSRAAVAANNAALANQINPNINGGVFQDAVGFLTGIQRTAQSQTIVSNVTIAGVAGTVIAQGSQAQTAAGDIFITQSSITLDVNGNGLVNFASQSYGPIPCAIGALTQIVSNVLGWETVTNPIAGILGATTQSDQAFRALRQNTLSFQGVALANAQTSSLYATAGVTSLFYQENVEKYTQTIKGIVMKGSSVYACVAGGTDTDVAAALLENKSSGGGWNGSTTINIIEPSSGQSYAVQFDRPVQIGFLVNVYTSNGNAANIIQAILDYQVGNIEGMPGLIVGAAVSTSQLAAAIGAENPGYLISQITTSLVTPVNFTSNQINIAVNAQAFTQQSYINVIIT